MGDLVERVARALASYNWPGASKADIDEMWDGWVGEARSAISAMAEPTPAMIEAGQRVDGTVTAADVYRAMIAAAGEVKP